MQYNSCSGRPFYALYGFLLLNKRPENGTFQRLLPSACSANPNGLQEPIYKSQRNGKQKRTKAAEPVCAGLQISGMFVDDRFCCVTVFAGACIDLIGKQGCLFGFNIPCMTFRGNGFCLGFLAARISACDGSFSFFSTGGLFGDRAESPTVTECRNDFGFGCGAAAVGTLIGLYAFFRTSRICCDRTEIPCMSDLREPLNKSNACAEADLFPSYYTNSPCRRPVRRRQIYAIWRKNLSPHRTP